MIASGVGVVEASQPDLDGHYHAELGIGILCVFVAITTSGTLFYFQYFVYSHLFELQASLAFILKKS